MSYSVKFVLDTWLKLTTDQGATLPDSQRQYIEAGTELPLAAYSLVGNHLRMTLGQNNEGQQIFFKGRNTWFVYEPAVDILRNGEEINLFPPTTDDEPSIFQLKIKSDTWFKLNTDQSSALPDGQKYLVRANTTMPLNSYTLDGSHLKLALGQDGDGQQIHLQGRNTWYVYALHVEVLQEGRPVQLSQPAVLQSTGQINDKGLHLLKSFEGLRLKAYLDAVGVWTIGYGTTRGVRPGMQITKAEAEALLRDDLRKFEQAVSSNIQVPLNSDQFSALVSFTYNVGAGALASSTLRRLLNQNNYSTAAEEFLRWNKGGGRVLAGLTRRRRAERALFLGEDYRVFL
ncbi:MAG: lysozyme [Thainema sp.]